MCPYDRCAYVGAMLVHSYCPANEASLLNFTEWYLTPLLAGFHTGGGERGNPPPKQLQLINVIIND